MTWVGAVSPSLFGYISKLRRNRKKEREKEKKRARVSIERRKRTREKRWSIYPVLSKKAHQTYGFARSS